MSESPDSEQKTLRESLKTRCAQKKYRKKTRATLGKFEWHPGAVKKFQTTAGGKGALATVGGLGVNCETEHSTGEYSGTKEVKNVVVKFNGCESAARNATPRAPLRGNW